MLAAGVAAALWAGLFTASARNEWTAERVVIHYQNGSFQVLERTPVMKNLPASDTWEATAVPRSGFWFELHSADGRVLYRKITSNPLVTRFEGPDLLNGGVTPQLTEELVYDKVFSLLLPRAQVGDQLVLFGSPQFPGALMMLGASSSLTAHEMARIPIQELPPPVRLSPGPGDGAVIGATKFVDNGPDAQRFNIVLIAEGYQENELTNFHKHAQQFADFFLKTPPFDRYCKAFNIWRIDVKSTDSGADSPAPPADNPGTPEDESTFCAGGTGTSVRTYFDATFCGDGRIHRLLTVNNGTAISVLNAQVPQWDSALVIVNTTDYGGAGGQVGTTSLAGTWENIAIHEMGHSAFGLADEYEYWAGCGVDAAGTRDNYAGAEPAEPNVTIETDRTKIKWRDLILASTAIPTTVNADCTRCDPQGNPFPGQTVVGLYEGAKYFHCDAYRPTFDCMMRNFAVFCPVCTKRITDDLAPYIQPNQPPQCSAGGPYTAECAGAATSVTLDASGCTDDGCAPLTYKWSGPFLGGTATGQKPTLQFSGTGNYTVQLEVSDGLLSSTCSAQVTVQDTTPPVIGCPTNIVAANDPGQCSAVVFYTITALDICSSTVTVVANPPSGSVFPKGTTPVTATATDEAGLSSTCTFTVTVEDREAPKTAVRPTTNPGGKKVPTAGTNPASGMNPDGFYKLLAVDNCDASPKIYVKDSASSFVAGPYLHGTSVKITQDPTGIPVAKKMAGAILAHIILNGDALVYATDADGNVSIPIPVLVPPPPK